MEVPNLDLFQWEVTGKCNLSCDFCYVSAHSEIEDRFTERDVEKVIEGIKELEPPTVQFLGGEPLLKKETVLRAVKECGTAVDRFVITTNGTRITKEFLEDIKEYRDQVIFQLAIDGSEKEIHDKLRGEGVFEQVMEGVELLNQYGFKWGTNFLFTTFNYDDFGKTADLVDEKGGEFIQTLHVGETGRGVEFCEYGQIDEEKVEQVKKKMMKKAKENNMGMFTESFLLPHEKEKAEELKDDDDTVFGCGAGVERAIVLYTNHLAPCGAIREGDLTLELDGKGVKEVYDSLADKYLETIKEYKKEFCGDCEYIPKCHPRACQMEKDSFI